MEEDSFIVPSDEESSNSQNLSELPSEPEEESGEESGEEAEDPSSESYSEVSEDEKPSWGRGSKKFQSRKAKKSEEAEETLCEEVVESEELGASFVIENESMRSDSKKASAVKPGFTRCSRVIPYFRGMDYSVSSVAKLKKRKIEMTPADITRKVAEIQQIFEVILPTTQWDSVLTRMKF